MKILIDKLKETKTLTKEEWIALIANRTPALAEYLFEQAREVREEYYGKDIYIRGLIEFTNYCKNDCYYCGIRRSNQNCERYRLTEEDILECCREGYELGFRTFVLQGGEDGYFTDDYLCSLIEEIKHRLFSSINSKPNFKKTSDYFISEFKYNMENIYTKLNEKYRIIYYSCWRDRVFR